MIQFCVGSKWILCDVLLNIFIKIFMKIQIRNGCGNMRCAGLGQKCVVSENLKRTHTHQILDRLSDIRRVDLKKNVLNTKTVVFDRENASYAKIIF